LFDADIIIFESNFDNYKSYTDYKGKKTYNENISSNILEDTKHWRYELSEALDHGKTIFVFFRKFQEVYIHTGEEQVSGTGKNARVKRIVEPFNNYAFFPIELPQVISKGGTELIFTNYPILSSFWTEFKEYISYESYLNAHIENPLFLTKTARKPIGGIFKVGKGHLILLPPLRYPKNEFIKYDKEKDQSYWTKEALKFGRRLVQLLVEIDVSLRGMSESTPPPEWVEDNVYKLESVEKIKKSLSKLTTKIDKLISAKTELLKDLSNEEKIKNLLFEKGKPLENSVHAAMQLLGYKSENFNDGKMELDCVILSPDGDRFIGEVEGKDSTAINIEKFRQLESNIQEDLARDEIDSPAIGILFGNGFRLSKPENRPEQFSEKCLQNAARSNTILIRTADLFPVVKYIKESRNKEFAEQCRNTIRSSMGQIVTFPTIPNDKNTKSEA